MTSLVETLKRFHTLFWCFDRWIWTSHYRLGKEHLINRNIFCDKGVEISFGEIIVLWPLLAVTSFLRSSGTATAYYEFSSIRPPACNVFSGLSLNFFLIFCVNFRFNKHQKMTMTFFWEIFLLWLKWGKWAFFISKISLFELSFKSVHQIFLILCMMKGIKK